MLDHLYVSIEREMRGIEDILLEDLRSGIDMVDSISSFATKNGGKRIRPAIFLLAARISGAPSDDLVPIGAAMEMLHTASLLHDDVIDDAAVRRGNRSVKARWGNQASVLVGDFFWCRAMKILIRYDRGGLLRAVADAVDMIIRGELLEIERHCDIHMNCETYMEIIRGKTAALFSLSARAGALIAGVSDRFDGALSSYGMNMGQAFQLADDVMDYIADEGRLGKAAGQDLREGKLTYPLIFALARADNEERTVVREAIIAKQLSTDQFDNVKNIVMRHGGIEATLDLAREFSEESKRCLGIFRPSTSCDALMGLADYVVDRIKV